MQNTAEARESRDDTSRQPASGRDHGRDAESPKEISGRGWMDVLWRVKGEATADNLGLVAAGVAFFAMLALFPTLIAAVSIYGLAFSPEQVQQQIESVSHLLPASARDVLTSQLNGIVEQASAALSWGAALAILGALWTASSGTVKLIKALDIAYGAREERGFIRQRGLALLLTIGLIVGGLVALGVVAVLPAVSAYLGLGDVAANLVLYGRWPLLALFAMAGLAVLYNVAPNRERPKWRWVTWGSAFTTLLWLVASIGFSQYVQNFGSFGEVYGTLAGVIVLMLWTYLSAYVVLLGAELNAELEAQTRKDSTVGEPRPMGQRGARPADVLGPARG